MLKQLTVPVLGLAVLAFTTLPAAAEKRGAYVGKVTPGQTYLVEPQTKKKVVTSKSKKSQQTKKFDPKLDFETEAVWRNLRPEWFD
jgi:hypothetical protein